MFYPYIFTVLFCSLELIILYYGFTHGYFGKCKVSHNASVFN